MVQREMRAMSHITRERDKALVHSMMTSLEAWAPRAVQLPCRSSRRVFRMRTL
ncbi:hypothetical protein N7499_013139 [Penicillium canescens]|nr:hypothetical protein N7499_013139 [Penicillium canescens]